MDLYFEQSVSNNYPNRGKKRKIVFTVLKWISLVSGCIMLLIAFVSPISEDASLTNALVQTGIFIAMAVPFFVVWFLCRRYVLTLNPEFDYVINGNEFRVVRIQNKTRRKKVRFVKMENIQEIGRIDSDAFERLSASPQMHRLKKIYAIANPEDEENIHYAVIKSDDESLLLFFEPSPEMLISIKRTLPRAIMINSKGYSY